MAEVLRTFDYSAHAKLETYFNEMWITKNLSCVAAKYMKGKIDPEKLLELGNLLHYKSMAPSKTYILENDDNLIYIEDRASSDTLVHVAGKSIEFVENKLAALSELFEEEVIEQRNVSVQFWYNTPSGTSSRTRKIQVPCWNDIQENYTTSVRSSIKDLLDFTKDSEHGLILWTGDPGTGKTTAIRALAQSWKSWASISVITDPEVFLNNLSYLNDVVFTEEELYVGGEVITVDKPNLLILEDAGELITADAKTRTGQALSRLLNVADGLLGQGIQLYILITTNENLGALHPAIHRPGRAIQKLEFEPLSETEAQTWLENHNVYEEISGPQSIANLYAIMGGTTLRTERKPIFGFADDSTSTSPPL